MKRCIPKENIGNKIRFIYAKIDNFSIEKSNKLYEGKSLFDPTLLLTDLYTILENGRKINIDHAWINVTESLLDLNLAIDDTIAFTARPLIYEKRNNNGDIILDIGINNIFNIKILSRNISRLNTFDNFIMNAIKDKNLLMPDKFMEYYKNIIKR